VIVNNAGYGYLSAVEEGDDDEVRALFDTNFFGAVDMVKAVDPAATITDVQVVEKTGGSSGTWRRA